MDKEMENLTPKEAFLYEIIDLDAQFINGMINLLPEMEKDYFNRRQSDINYRIFSTRRLNSGLMIEYPILEDELRVFKNELFTTIKNSLNNS